MFNINSFEELKAKQPLMAIALKQLGENYINFATSNSFNENNLRRFYSIAETHHLFNGVDLSIDDVNDMLKYIS